MNLLVFDTATPSTVVGAYAGDGPPAERRHDPGPGERPGHAQHLLALAGEALAEAGIAWEAIDRIGVGVGPGTFTGLRIGVATARSLAQATGAELAAVSSLGALAAGAAEPDRVVLAVLDARRGEAFAAAWRGDERLLAPRAVAPADLAATVREASAMPPAAPSAPARPPSPTPSAPAHPPLAIGDGAVKFREQLEAAGAVVPEDGAALHRIGAAGLRRLAAGAPAVDRDALVPEYVRPPDAKPRSAQ